MFTDELHPTDMSASVPDAQRIVYTEEDQVKYNNGIQFLEGLQERSGKVIALTFSTLSM